MRLILRPSGARWGARVSPTYDLSLIVALAATIAALALAWARNGAVAGLLDTVLRQVRGMLGIG